MGTTWPCFNIDSQAEYWKKTHVVYLVGSAWYHVLSAQTERDHYWGTLPNTIDEIEPSTQGKRAHYYSKHDKFILLHDNARPHVAAPVKTYLETLKWEVLPPPAVFSSHCSFRLLLVSIDAWPVWAALHIWRLWRYQKLYRWWPQKMKRSSDAVSTSYQEDGKKY